MTILFEYPPSVTTYWRIVVASILCAVINLQVRSPLSVRCSAWYLVRIGVSVRRLRSIVGVDRQVLQGRDIYRHILSDKR